MFNEALSCVMKEKKLLENYLGDLNYFNCYLISIEALISVNLHVNLNSSQFRTGNPKALKLSYCWTL